MNNIFKIIKIVALVAMVSEIQASGEMNGPHQGQTSNPYQCDYMRLYKADKILEDTSASCVIRVKAHGRKGESCDTICNKRFDERIEIRKEDKVICHRAFKVKKGVPYNDQKNLFKCNHRAIYLVCDCRFKSVSKTACVFNTANMGEARERLLVSEVYHKGDIIEPNCSEDYYIPGNPDPMICLGDDKVVFGHKAVNLILNIGEERLKHFVVHGGFIPKDSDDEEIEKATESVKIFFEAPKEYTEFVQNTKKFPDEMMKFDRLQKGEIAQEEVVDYAEYRISVLSKLSDFINSNQVNTNITKQGLLNESLLSNSIEEVLQSVTLFPNLYTNRTGYNRLRAGIYAAMNIGQKVNLFIEGIHLAREIGSDCKEMEEHQCQIRKFFNGEKENTFFWEAFATFANGTEIDDIREGFVNGMMSAFFYDYTVIKHFKEMFALKYGLDKELARLKSEKEGISKESADNKSRQIEEIFKTKLVPIFMSGEKYEEQTYELKEKQDEYMREIRRLRKFDHEKYAIGKQNFTLLDNLKQEQARLEKIETFSRDAKALFYDSIKLYFSMAESHLNKAKTRLLTFSENIFSDVQMLLAPIRRAEKMNERSNEDLSKISKSERFREYVFSNKTATEFRNGFLSLEEFLEGVDGFGIASQMRYEDVRLLKREMFCELKKHKSTKNDKL